MTRLVRQEVGDHFTAVQEAVERGGQKDTALVWRGYYVVAGEEVVEELLIGRQRQWLAG